VFQKPLLGVHNTMPNLYNKNEIWHEPSLVEIGEAMKECYQENLNKSNIDLVNNSKSVLKRFSYETTGTKLKNIIEEHISHE